MKINYGHLSFCELAEIEGTAGVIILDGQNANNDQIKDKPRFVPRYELTEKDDRLILDMIDAACWPPITAMIDPYRYESGERLDYTDWNRLQERILEIVRRLAVLYDKSMYYKDQRDVSVRINFILNSYFKEEFDYAPRIMLRGTTESGKSRDQKILAGLCYRGSELVKSTLAAMFRLLHMYQITPICDEVQRLKGQAKDDIEDIILIGFEKGKKITRTDKETYKPRSYNVYAPMLISVKAGGYTAEDIDNRAFVSNMIQNPINVKVDPILDKEEIANIRNMLYSLYLLYKAHPEAFRFKELIAESIKHLTEVDPDNPEQGHICDYLRDTFTPEALTGRARDNAITYYTLSRFTATEEETLSLLTDSQKRSRERNKDTLEAGIFSGYMKCCLEIYEMHSWACYEEILSKVPTKDIAEKYNICQEEGGNQRGMMDKISTNKITRTLKDMGFDIRSGTAGKSFVNVNSETDRVIDTCHNRFGSEEDEDILHKIRARPRIKLTSKLTKKQELAES